MSPTANESKFMEERAVFNIRDAKSNLSRLVEQAVAGREIIIARDGKPVARLVALESGRRGMRLGIAAGRFSVPDDFDDPLPDALWGDLLTSDAS